MRVQLCPVGLHDRSRGNGCTLTAALITLPSVMQQTWKTRIGEGWLQPQSHTIRQRLSILEPFGGNRKAWGAHMHIIHSLNTSHLYTRMIILQGSLQTQWSNLCPSSTVDMLGVAIAQPVLRTCSRKLTKIKNRMSVHCVFTAACLGSHKTLCYVNKELRKRENRESFLSFSSKTAQKNTNLKVNTCSLVAYECFVSYCVKS